jgi:hypothetical protein
MILETFTTKTDDIPLPDFIQVEKEITRDPAYSMHTLSRKAVADSTVLTPEKSKSVAHSNFAKIEVSRDRNLPDAHQTSPHDKVSNGEIRRAESISGTSGPHKEAKTRSISDAGNVVLHA